MKTIRVENINNSPNQFRVWTKQGMYFQSYNSIILFIPYDSGIKTQLDKNTWDYSSTTGRYRNIVLGEDKKETERKIKEGFYKLVDLN